MKHLLLHPQTRQQLEAFVAKPSHASLLAGPAGSGKLTIATNLAQAVLGLPDGGLSAHPYAKIITPVEGKAIGIDVIRELEHFLALKVPGSAEHDRVVIIENAQLLTLEAQNALLKTLEEPPKGTLLLLTADSEQALLPTIRSRAATINIIQPHAAALTERFLVRFEAEAIKQAQAISGGLPGLMNSLLSDQQHPLVLATERARQLLGQTTYERLLAVDELSKQRQLASDTTYILQQMARLSLQTATGPAAIKWQSILNAGYEASEALNNSAQPKLALTKLMLSL